MCAHALNVGNGLVEVLHCDTEQALSILSGYHAEAQYNLRILGQGSILSRYQAKVQYTSGQGSGYYQ